MVLVVGDAGNFISMQVVLQFYALPFSLIHLYTMVNDYRGGIIVSTV